MDSFAFLSRPFRPGAVSRGFTMRRRFAIALSTCALSVGLASAAEPQPTDEPTILTARLGSDEFTVREAAARQLERLGSTALPALRAACKSADPEVRRRADALVERIERTSESARLLSIAPITLNYDRMPLGTAVADLRARTKIPPTLNPAGVANPLRLVTVKTGPLPPWQAIEEFCRAAGLKEVFTAELPPPKPTPQRLNRGFYTPPDLPQPNVLNVPVVLADGTMAPLPGERSGAVRILALPSRFSSNRVVLGSGEVTLNLDVAPAPGQQWQDILGVRIRQAIDARGRWVPVSHRIDLGPAMPEGNDNFMMINGGMAMLNGRVEPGQALPSLPNPRIVPITLRTGDSGIRSLRLLEGDVQIEATVPNQPLLTIEHLPKAMHTAHDAPNMHRVSIGDILPDPKQPEQTIIKLRIEWPSPWLIQQMKAQRVAGNLGGFMLIEPTLPPTQGPQFHISGEDGKPLTSTSTTYNSGQTDDMKIFTEIGLTVRGKPTKLVMVGPKTVTVDVPFRMENVILP